MEDPRPIRKGLSADWAVREVDHLFARLTRYTRFVLYSKWFLGVLAIVLMVSLVAFPLLTKDRSGIRVSFGDNTGKTSGPATSPVMSNPLYSGSNEKGEQFKVKGVRAIQKTSALVELEQVESHLLKADGGWLALTADRGEFYQDKKIVELYGNVTILNDKGYNFVTSHATVDTNTMDAHGNEPVSGTSPTGNLLASGFKMRDNGSTIEFTGRGARQYLQIDQAKQKP